MFSYPSQALFNRVIPKSKIYGFAKPSRAVKDRFVSQILEIVWKYKLSPETINLPARQGVQEIQVFEITLKNGELSEDVLRAIDKAIPSHIFYRLIFANQIRYTAAYKRPNDADASRFVIEAYFETPWQPVNNELPALPVVLDLAMLYEYMLRTLIPLPPRPGESLKDQVGRMAQLRVKERECRDLEARMLKEKQFNRKVELNARLRTLKIELDTLSIS